jgi:hypothetical protein
MPSLTDLFNPSFLMFLGILVLVVALLVVYFESKMREQNHKIASMLSLVSTLAEDINGIKYGLNQLSVASVNNNQNLYTADFSENVRPLEDSFYVEQNNTLINVSDDDSDDESDDDSDDESDDDSDDVSDTDSDNVSDTDSDDNNNEDIKVLKLTINKEFDENDNLEEIEYLDDNLSISQSDSSEINNDIDTTILDYEEEKLDEEEEKPVHQEEKLELVEENANLEPEFKKININLEETIENQDYKKLSLNKLRSIVTEKGLSSDPSKLKKPELLKLLEVE